MTAVIRPATVTLVLLMIGCSGGKDELADDGNADESGPGEGDSAGEPMFDPSWEKLELRFEKYEVPTDETMYTCVGFTLPAESKRHMVAFDPLVDDAAVVHHLVLYRLATPMAAGFQECFEMPDATEATWAWAPGSSTMILPEEAGIALGDNGTESHFALQLHYNNPLGEAGHVDSSGVVVYIAPEPRANDVGTLAIGVYNFEIPAGEPSYEVNGVCDTTDTLNSPINVFAGMLHLHELGRQIWTDHLRAEQRIGDVGTDTTYSFHEQKFAPLNVIVQPGDVLDTHCIWDSTSREQPTRFGLRTSDEMCINYLMYYPKQQIPYCLK